MHIGYLRSPIPTHPSKGDNFLGKVMNEPRENQFNFNIINNNHVVKYKNL